MEDPVQFDAYAAEGVARLVKQYCAEQRNPDLPGFTIHPLQTWMGGWWGQPNCLPPGCYLIYGADGELLYIGKASMGASIGSRLAAHERRRDGFFGDARYIQTVEVCSAFEAPSLEEYLLMHLDPRLNSVGRR